jgi:flavin reductase (DIM6/NTAB) family NADH-FMN oxidoreductase RutF
VPVEQADLIRVMARVPAPVTVVTTVNGNGEPRGFTATSFTSLSLTPPLVLVCLAKTASTHPSFTQVEHFMINLLADDQHEVASRFARTAAERFSAGDMEPSELGMPGLPQAAARIACALHDVLDGGDHSILVGRVEAVHVSDRNPLVHWNRTYARPTREPDPRPEAPRQLKA